jgi:hypothetical protein
VFWLVNFAYYWTTNSNKTFDGVPEPDGSLQTVVRDKIRHYGQNYVNQPDPMSCIPVTVDTSGRIYDYFSRLLFFHAHREVLVLTNELPEESDQFCFLCTDYLTKESKKSQSD